MQGLLRTTPPGLLTQFNFGAKTATLIRGYAALEVIGHLCTAHQDLKNALVNRRRVRKQLFGVLFSFPGPLASGPSQLSGFEGSSKDFQGVVRMCKDF